MDELIDAARRLLEARDAQMLGAVEWDALQHALGEALMPDDDCGEAFVRRGAAVGEEDALVRLLESASGHFSSRSTCDESTLHDVASAFREQHERGFLIEEMRQKVLAAWTEVEVAVAFLVSVGLVQEIADRRYRWVRDRHVEDALDAFVALESERAGL